MGQTQSSRNYLNNLTETITRIIQENAQTCKVNATQVQEIVASGNCSINLKNVVQNQLIGVDFDCMQQADLNAKVASEMQVQLEQLAKAFVSGLDFRIFSSQEAENFIMNHVRLVTEIVNRMQQECAVSAGQYQGFKCSGSGNILVTDSSLKQTITALYKCVQKGETVADVKTDIEQFIKQAAISENKGLSFDILFILLIVVIIGGVIFVLNKATDWKFLAIGLPILAIIGFIIYLVIANKKNWWPFKSKFDQKNRQQDRKIPMPEPPLAVQKVQKRQVQIQSDQTWGRVLLGLNGTCGGLSYKSSLTPEEYKQLKYGDAQIAFDTNFGRPYDNTKDCAMKIVDSVYKTTKIRDVPPVRQLKSNR